MPDLRRRSYFARDTVDLPASVRNGIDEAKSYREARALLRRCEIVPALTVDECAAVLLETGVQPERVQIVPVGVESAWQGEVVGQHPKPGEEINNETQVRIFVSHPSLKDRLPDGFVGRGPRRLQAAFMAWSEGAGTEAFWRQREALRREESPAMHVLRAFESELWQARLCLADLRNLFSGVADDSGLATELLRGIGSEADSPTAGSGHLRWLGRHLWAFRRTAGLERETEQLLEGLLAVPIRLEKNMFPPAEIPERLRPRLGRPDCVLGHGALVGKRLDDRIEGAIIVVGPLSFVEAQELARDNRFESRLERWSAALIPVGCPWRIEYRVNADATYPALGAASCGAILGRTARLSTAPR